MTVWEIVSRQRRHLEAAPDNSKLWVVIAIIVRAFDESELYRAESDSHTGGFDARSAGTADRMNITGQVLTVAPVEGEMIFAFPVPRIMALTLIAIVGDWLFRQPK